LVVRVHFFLSRGSTSFACVHVITCMHSMIPFATEVAAPAASNSTFGLSPFKSILSCIFRSFRSRFLCLLVLTGIGFFKSQYYSVFFEASFVFLSRSNVFI
jgi:hypothetical protein